MAAAVFLMRLFLFTEQMGKQVVDLIRAQASLEWRHAVLAIADHVGQFRPHQNVQRNRQTGLLCCFLDLQQSFVRASGQK